MDFAVEIIELVKYLKSKHETIIANQTGRSGTSINAIIYEANYAPSTKDFISKLRIALKEAVEQAIGLSFHMEQAILMIHDLNLFVTIASLLVLCL